MFIGKYIPKTGAEDEIDGYFYVLMEYQLLMLLVFFVCPVWLGFYWQT
jgi:hypothetical protein